MTDIVLLGDPVLTRRAPEETVFDGALHLIAQRVRDAARSQRCFGVAAPQLGVSRRLFAYHDGGKVKVLVNPRIVRERGTWTFKEGCLSIPRFFWMLERPKDVTVVAQDTEGEELVVEATDFVSRGLQHEIDHLNGVLLPDRIRETLPGLPRQQRRHAERELAKHGALVPA